MQPSSEGEESAGQSNKANEFVSALSWKSSSSKTYILLAANSQGNVKVWDLLYSTTVYI